MLVATTIFPSAPSLGLHDKTKANVATRNSAITIIKMVRANLFPITGFLPTKVINPTPFLMATLKPNQPRLTLYKIGIYCQQFT